MSPFMIKEQLITSSRVSASRQCPFCQSSLTWLGDIAVYLFNATLIVTLTSNRTHKHT